MRILSKIVFLCNICFLISIVLRFVELRKISAGDHSHVIPLPYVQSIIVLMGYSAVYINFIFIILLAIRTVLRKPVYPRWLNITNVFFFIFQLYYYLIYT